MDIITAVIKDKNYDDSKVQGWVDEICSRVMKELIESNKPYKYMISCTIMQKNGAGLHLGKLQYLLIIIYLFLNRSILLLGWSK